MSSILRGACATLAIAVLAAALPAAAISNDDLARLLHDPAYVPKPADQRPRDDALRSDPILRYQWGPGDADLVARHFHFTLSIPPKPMTPDERVERVSNETR